MSKNKKSFRAVALPFYSIGEEIVSSILHGIGAMGAAAGLVLLSLKTRGILGGQRASDLDIFAALLFTAAMIIMFLISTIYHAVQRQNIKRILRRLDHSIIFIFIAATYTPICLSGLGGTWGWSLFAVEWVLALIGITLNILDKISNIKVLKKFEVAAYILMGWVIIVGFIPLFRSIPSQSIILIFTGGTLYSLGTIWYRMKKIKHTHAVWHIFVIMGTICHWFSIWYLY
jgi:hemolysin III